MQGRAWARPLGSVRRQNKCLVGSIRSGYRNRLYVNAASAVCRKGLRPPLQRTQSLRSRDAINMNFRFWSSGWRFLGHFSLHSNHPFPMHREPCPAPYVGICLPGADRRKPVEAARVQRHGAITSLPSLLGLSGSAEPNPRTPDRVTTWQDLEEEGLLCQAEPKDGTCGSVGARRHQSGQSCIS